MEEPLEPEILEFLEKELMQKIILDIAGENIPEPQMMYQTVQKEPMEVDLDGMVAGQILQSQHIIKDVQTSVYTLRPVAKVAQITQLELNQHLQHQQEKQLR